MDLLGNSRCKEINGENTILYDVHQDQRNMLHLTCNGDKKSCFSILTKIPKQFNGKH